MIKTGDKVTVTGNRGIERMFPDGFITQVEQDFTDFQCDGNPEGYHYVVVRNVYGGWATLRAHRCTKVGSHGMDSRHHHAVECVS